MSRVLLCTESTYLVATGGVDTWCQMLVGGLEEIDYRGLVVAPWGRRSLYRRPPAGQEIFVLPSVEASLEEVQKKLSWPT